MSEISGKTFFSSNNCCQHLEIKDNDWYHSGNVFFCKKHGEYIGSTGDAGESRVVFMYCGPGHCGVCYIDVKNK